MADEPPTTRWLPPQAPGGRPPPRFEAEPPPERPAPPPRPAAPAPSPPTPADRPVFVRPRAGSGNNGLAVASLVLGVVGLALLVLSLGLGFALTLPCSAAAWVLGRRALRQIERGASARGAGQAQLALWLGRIGVVVGLGALIMFVVLSLAGFDFDQFRESLQRDLERRRDAAR
jgi:hypothetical protein